MQLAKGFLGAFISKRGVNLVVKNHAKVVTDNLHLSLIQSTRLSEFK